MIIGLLDQEKNTIKLNYDIFYFFFNLIIIVNLIIILKDQKLIYQIAGEILQANLQIYHRSRELQIHI